MPRALPFRARLTIITAALRYADSWGSDLYQRDYRHDQTIPGRSAICATDLAARFRFANSLRPCQMGVNVSPALRCARHGPHCDVQCSRPASDFFQIVWAATLSVAARAQPAAFPEVSAGAYP